MDTATWIALFAAIATFLVAVVALFGDAIKAKWLGPKLRLDLLSPLGNLTSVPPTKDEAERKPARYHHVRLTNQRRWSRATQARVYLLQVEEPGPDGTPQTRWAGDIPLRWRWQDVYPLERQVGPEAVCDLCSVVKGKRLSVETLILPAALEPHRVREIGTSVDMTLVLQARSAEGESPVTSFGIAWDGRWEDGDAEMATHLVVKQLSQQREPASADTSRPGTDEAGADQEQAKSWGL